MEIAKSREKEELETMQIDPLGALSAPPTQPEGANSPTKLKEEFLMLLITQIQNQDPLNPLDPAAFTSQLAEFSSLEQLIGINQLLDEQASLQAVAIGTSAAAFVGQNAEVRSTQLGLREGVADGIRFNLSADSSETTLRILDSTGRLVRSVSLGAAQSGDNEYAWDGLDDAGETVADGLYRFEVAASNADGQPIALSTSIVGIITGIRFENGLVLLRIGEQKFVMGALIGLGEAEQVQNSWNGF